MSKVQNISNEEKLRLVVANVLSGKVNPSGRLTETYAYSVKDIPSENTKRDESVMVYEEGLNVGYCYFDEYFKNGWFLRRKNVEEKVILRRKNATKDKKM